MKGYTIHIGIVALLLSPPVFSQEYFLTHHLQGVGIHLIWDRWLVRGEYGNHGKGWGFINLGTGIKF